MTPPYLTHLLRRMARGVLLAGLLLCLAAVSAHAGTGGAGLGGGTGSSAPTGGASAAPSPAPRHAKPRHRRVRKRKDTRHRTIARHRRTAPHRATHHRAVHIAPAPTPPTASGRLVITGGGDGHGIGMSQYGAEGYALHGFSDAQILAHYYQGTALGHTDPGQLVRVLLADGHASFSGATAAGTIALSATETYTVTLVGPGLAITAPSGRVVATVPGPLTVTGPGPLASAGGLYRGSLVFSADGDGGVRTVNAVGLDDYVRGVVAAEVPSSWAPAALEAQAIAARTYAITTSVDGQGFNLYDDTRSQMYGGVNAETATSNAAVTATAGQVVTYDGAPAVTYFFSSSGGDTESIQNVWTGSAPEPWLRGVPDPYDGAADNPYHSWRLTFTLAAATAKLHGLVDGTLERIVVTRRGVSPRVITAQVVGSQGTTTVTGSQLAAAFGLLSTDMSFSVG
jgi:stage II sporulation protein D